MISQRAQVYAVVSSKSRVNKMVKVTIIASRLAHFERLNVSGDVCLEIRSESAYGILAQTMS